MIEAEAAERFLAGPWSADADRVSRQALLESLAEERAGAGTVLLAQGHPNDHLSFLIGGSAVIERARGGGRAEAIATLHAPTIFGTTSFFRPDPPTFRVRAAADVWLLTLYHEAHDRLRRDHPRAAEALATAVVVVLSERLDELDRLFSDYMARHPADPSKVSEWAGFRARLFEAPADGP